MKSSVFKITPENVIKIASTGESRHPLRVTCCVPIFDAFAIEHFSVDAPMGRWEIEDTDVIDGNIFSYNTDTNVPSHLHVTIYYHGVKDHASLFPFISDTDLRNRLGRFYEECESCFENCNWLAFSLMCGAIFEGILYNTYKKRMTYLTLVNMAERDKKIDSKTAKIMHTVRNQRNLIHAKKFRQPYPERKDAYEIRTVLDKIIYEFSAFHNGGKVDIDDPFEIRSISSAGILISKKAIVA